MTKEELLLIVNACRWWDSKKPTDYTDEQHLENPTVNCINGWQDEALAEAVAAYLRQADK